MKFVIRSRIWRIGAWLTVRASRGYTQAQRMAMYQGYLERKESEV